MGRAEVRNAAEGLPVDATDVVGGIVGEVSLREAELVRRGAVLQLRSDDLVHKVLQGATFDTLGFSSFSPQVVVNHVVLQDYTLKCSWCYLGCYFLNPSSLIELYGKIFSIA